MRRGGVAIVGTWSLFTGSVVAALELRGSLHVRRFSSNDEAAHSEMDAFDPDVVVVVGSCDLPIPQAALRHVEKGRAIITLDPTESTMSFFCRTRRTQATLDSVLDAIWAARIITGRDRTSQHVFPSTTRFSDTEGGQ